MNDPKDNPEDKVRPHVFDGIQEYEKSMPNWWLATLFGAIVFSFAYWFYFHTLGHGKDPGLAVTEEIQAARAVAANSNESASDASLWALSHDSAAVESGRNTFVTTCASCHKPDLTGMIGPNLVDKEWIHGGLPLEVTKTITDGNLVKGMPAWGPVLGKQKIKELTAYVMSHHQPGEAIIQVSGWTMQMPGAPVPEITTTPPEPQKQ